MEVAVQVPAWKGNERRVYLGNFLHMTMYTMCLGGIFDLFLYNLSQEQQILLKDTITIGHDLPPPPHTYVNTESEFTLTFKLRPFSNPTYHKDDPCWRTLTCASTIFRFIDSSADSGCCRVGDRVPALYFGNSTQLNVDMDAVGQNESMSTLEYLQLQRCFGPSQLTIGDWHDIKIKAASMSKGKGKMGSSGGLCLHINGSCVCEIAGSKYHTLPSFKQSYVFFGSLQAPFSDLHLTANAQISDMKYGKPASNLFVGVVNSVQGVLSIFIMYPIGWIGDKMNRYTLLRANLSIGAVAAVFLSLAVLSRNLALLFTGIVVFTFYQQCISAMIYAVLADNVEKPRRTKASANYKTFSALAMSFAPAIQLVVLFFGPIEDNWTSGTFDALLLPGWAMLPLLSVVLCSLTTVGKKICDIPNVDDAEMEGVRREPSRKLNDGWLDQRVLFNQRRRFVVALAVNMFFIVTLLANGMTVRYFALYFTQILKFTPSQLCLLNAVCRLWIAGFAQLANPLAKLIGRSNTVLLFHLGSAFFTIGIYGANYFQPSTLVACACYMMRFACLHSRDPLLYSMTMDVVPPEQRSRWSSLNSLRTLSFSASAVLGGYLADNYGYEFSFNITVVSLLACTVVFIPAWMFFPRSEGEGAAEGQLVSLRTVIA